MNIDQTLDDLIRYLLDEERPDAPRDIPNNRADKWRLFRALVNVRPPRKASECFLAAQDELLQTLIAEKGITDIASLRPVRGNLYLWRGDITTLKAGAIVNAANSGLLGCFAPNHACIDNAIHTFAGVQLRLECAAIMAKQDAPEPTGKAKITAAYNLPSSHILHTVGPVIEGGVTENDRRLLADCYRSCLELAAAHKIESVAFCCISTGVFHFPAAEAARIAVDTVSRFLKDQTTVKEALFNVFTEQDERIYRALLG